MDGKLSVDRQISPLNNQQRGGEDLFTHEISS